ncbi:MAG: hypothetical protein AB1728_14110 [Bacteroidota bacterium]
MKHNRIILISEHAIDRFIERFHFAGKESPRTSEVRIAAERAVQQVWSEASYISDDEEGILFRNREFQCDFIVKNKQITTLFPTKINGAHAQPDNHSSEELRMQHHHSRFRKPKNPTVRR